MKRISSNMSNIDLQYHLRLREWQMNNQQNKIAKQSRIDQLRDDPIAAANSSRFLSRIARIERFTENAETVRSDSRIAEGYMRTAVDIFHRIRELALKGANGTYSKEDTRHMASEVNEFLKELTDLANATDANGRTIFGGEKTEGSAYRIQEGHIPGVAEKLISNVFYLGDIESGQVEVGEGSYVESRMVGNRVFWAENQQLFGLRNVMDYQVDEDSTIRIDGEEIALTVGDNIHVIMAKINASGAAVEASLDPVTSGFNLRTTVPHQLWLENGTGMAVLTDLGLIDNYNPPPHNVEDGVALGGGSSFDVIIRLRDALYEGNQFDLGGSLLNGIDLALGNLLSEVGKLGSRDERLQLVEGRMAYELTEVQEKNSDQVGLDMAKAITDLKMLEYNHKATLQTAARILQPTLLDFLR